MRTASTSLRLMPKFQSGVILLNSEKLQSSSGIANRLEQISLRQQHRCMGTWPKVVPVRIRAISMDVTGTLVSFRGSLSQHYLGSAAKCGVELEPNAPIGPAFRQAYQEISQSKC